MKPLINLELGEVAYCIGQEALTSAKKYLTPFAKRYVLVDENTEKYCLPVFKERLPDIALNGIIRIPSGEENKEITQCIHIWKSLTELGADRDSVLLNLGGGVISDIGGFTAATYKRGMSFINIPTTLLGAIDAAIGGKTGIDFMNYKNQVGLFTDPVSVIIDTVFLKTLDDIYWQSGYAELLKYGLIMDRDLWQMLSGKKYKEITDWDPLIMKAAKDKVDIVRYDTREKGIRKILNFGHTIGHSIETLYLNRNKPVTHGQAVAAGMICESYLSAHLTELECNPQGEICETIDLNFERIPLSEEDIPELLQLMKQDKKVRAGHFKFSLLRRLGKAIHDVEVEDDLVIKALKFYIHNEKCR